MCVRVANLDKKTKGTIKGLKRDKTKLGKEVEYLKLKLDTKSKDVDDAMAKKKRMEDKMQKLRDQLVQATKDKEEAVKAAREEVEINAAEVVEGMKSYHSKELVQSHEQKWNATTNAFGNHIKKLKDHMSCYEV